MSNKVNSLRKKYPKFIYKEYSYKINKKDLIISFYFLIEPSIKFKPKVIIKGIGKKRLNRINKKDLNNLIFHLGLIEMLSYWKATCSPKIEIRADKLNEHQIKWWIDLIINGMGEFFYKNKIDWRKEGFLKLEAERLSIEDLISYSDKLKNKFIIPVGGGKDSIVTLEMLKNTKKKINCFSLNPTKPAKEIMRIAGFKNPLIVERKIDKKLIELNNKGFLNGHTPFSAYLAFLSVLLAVIFDCKYVAVSNEKSSNEGNVKYLNKEVNHQYSKSHDFEKKFRKYSKRYLASEIEYFSFLRVLNEVQIAKLFSKYPEYFSSFMSCNEAFKTNSGKKKKTGRWCGKCPKCLFVYTCLYPFLRKEQLDSIFGKDLFKDKDLILLMKELTGERNFKPFECVGTIEDSLVAFYLSWEKARMEENLPVLLKYFEKKILPKNKSIKNKAEKY
jgi:UDP-N-acetyl-alpha-D-muramoyl-L-alanyl-L-glutamate epimerase